MLHHDLIPYIKPAEMLAWMATNPLLVEAHPALCARRAEQLAAGELTKGQLTEKAGKMSETRARLRLKLPPGNGGELSETPDWLRIEELLQSRWIEGRERMTVRAFARQCHACEWPWLIARMEEVITRRADVQQQEFAQAA
jgi:hypothetical protein